MDDKKEIQSQPKPSVEIIYAGGTISSLATPEGHREGGHALDLVGLLEERASDFQPTFELGGKEVAYTGLSENMDQEYWDRIDSKVAQALSRNPQGILVTHGTDSMEQTARHLREMFLDDLVANSTRIILTGANEDIEHPETDAWDNLRYGLESAASLLPPDVYVAFHGRLIPASDVVKLPYVKGGESGFVSREDPLYTQTLELQKQHSDRLIQQLDEIYSQPPDSPDTITYDVNVIRSNHSKLLEYVSKHPVKAILLTLYHSGTANTEKPEQSVAELVTELRTKHNIVCFGVTENGEAVDLHSYETSVKLRQAGIVPLYDMPRDVAIAKLQLIDKETGPVGIIEEMLTNRVGEIDESLVHGSDIAQLKTLYGTEDS